METCDIIFATVSPGPTVARKHYGSALAGYQPRQASLLKREISLSHGPE